MGNERSSEQAGRVYDAVSPIADAFGDGQFHLSYFYGAQDDTPFVTAAERISRKVADALGLRPGDHLLDAGCGPGATAVLIGKETGARITGISVSQYDVEEAERRAKLAGLGEQLRFEQGDYMTMTFPDGTFDAVMAIESLLCAPDLGYVLREFNRVLRPGGTVALCHCTLEKPMEPEQAARFAASIMATKLPTLQEWIGALEGAGFDVEEYTQCGPRVLGVKERYFQAVTDSHEALVAVAGEQGVAHFQRGLEDFFAPGPGHVGYAVIAGRKPVEPA